MYEYLCPHQCTDTLVLSFCVRRWLTLTTIFLHLSMAHKSHRGFDSLDGGASPLTSAERLHWTAMQSVSAYGQQRQLQPPLDQFREEECNCKRSQGVKRRNGFWAWAFLCTTVALNESELQFESGKTWGEIAGLHVNAKNLTEPLRMQEEFLGSNEYLPRIPSVPPPKRASALHFHFYKVPPSTCLPHLISAAFLFWYGMPKTPLIRHYITHAHLQNEQDLKGICNT